MSALVSIITACYNGSKFIEQYVQCMLEQTYINLEIIFVNDGSNDKSGELIQAYENMFLKRGIKFKYIYQKNGGLAKATNRGLREIKGKYFFLHDVDDLLTKDCVYKRVRFMESHPKCGIVHSRVWQANFNNYDKKELIWEDFPRNIMEFSIERFLKLKLSDGTLWNMFRTEFFDEIYPLRKISEKIKNIQDIYITIPLAHKYLCGFIDEPLGIYVRHDDNCSNVNNLVNKENLLSNYECAFIATIEKLDDTEVNKNRFANIVRQNFRRERIACLIKKAWELKLKDYKIKVALFGCGVRGIEMQQSLCEKNVEVVCFLDNDKAKWNKEINGIKIFSLEKLLNSEEKVYIIITTDRFMEEIKKQLMDKGLKENRDFCDYINFMLRDLMEYNETIIDV